MTRIKLADAIKADNGGSQSTAPIEELVQDGLLDDIESLEVM